MIGTHDFMNPDQLRLNKITIMAKIWEKLAEEPERAFLRFKKYREMGTKRSLRSLAKDEKVQLSAIACLSTKFEWQKRAAEWDKHVDQISQQNEIDEVLAMKKRQISLALKAQKVAEYGLEKLIRHIEFKEVSELRTLDLSKLLDIGCRLERLNRDEPEQSLEIKEQQNFDLLDEEELETMKRLLAKAEGKA